MSKIGLHDTIKVKNLARSSVFALDISALGESLTDDLRYLPVEKNLVYKAALEFCRKSRISFSAEVVLVKNIPSGAGLGGGSSNAAGMLQFLNNLFPVLSKGALKRVAAEIGADVPYCLNDGQMIATGTGNLLSKSHFVVEGYVVLVHPPVLINTKAAYNELDRLPFEKNLLTTPNTLRKEFGKKGLSAFLNDFERVAFVQYPELADIKARIQSLGAHFSLMTGSGSTVYGVFHDQFAAKRAFKALATVYDRVSVCELRK